MNRKKAIKKLDAGARDFNTWFTAQFGEGPGDLETLERAAEDAEWGRHRSARDCSPSGILMRLRDNSQRRS